MGNKKKVLIVVDVQNDFVTGSLGTPEAQAIVPKIKEKFEEYKNNGDYVVYTMDTHNSDYLNTSEGKKLPVLQTLQQKLGLKPSQIAIVEDTVKTLDYIRAHSDFVTVHVSSFME